MVNKNEKFTIKKRLESFKYAFNGLRILLFEEHNSRVHLTATIVVIGLGFFLEINQLEWLITIFLIGFVFSMELINSSIENLSDFVSVEKNEYIKKAKDLSAGAVFVAALVSLIIGLWIFVPKIISILN